MTNPLLKFDEFFAREEARWIELYRSDWSAIRAEREQLRGNLSLAEEGLANATEENQRLRDRLDKFRGLPEHWIALDGDDGEPLDPNYMRRAAAEPSELRPPAKLEDYGPVIEEVAPVSPEAWASLKSE